MSIEVDLLRYVGIYEEPGGSYQVDHTATPADFLAFPFEEGTLEMAGTVEPLDPLTGKMRLDGHDLQVLGVRKCTLALASMLHSHGLDLDGDVTAPDASNWALLRVLRAVMGGSIATTNVAAQTTVQAGTNVKEVIVTATHGARFSVGGVIACETVSGSTNLELREVVSVVGDTIGVKEDFSAVPITGTAVRGGVTLYMTEDPATALQVMIEGREATDGAVLRGMQGGFALTLPVGGRGQINFSLSGAGWARLGASSATIPSYTNTSFLALNPLELTVPTIGSTTRVLVPESELAVEPQITYAPVMSGAATETIARMRRQPTRPLVQGSFVAPYEDDTWYAARDNRTSHAVFAQGGATAGSAFLISIPTVQITDVQPTASGEGIAGQRVTFQGRHDEEIGGVTEIGYSAMRLHFV